MSLVGKISFSYFELCVFQVTYSRLPTTSSLAKSNQNEFSLDFFSYIYGHFTSVTRTSRELEVIFVFLQIISI